MINQRGFRPKDQARYRNYSMSEKHVEETGVNKNTHPETTKALNDSV